MLSQVRSECRTMAQVVSHGFDPGPVYVRRVVDTVALVKCFLRELRFFLCQHFSISAEYSSSSAELHLWTNGRSLGTFK